MTDLAIQAFDADGNEIPGLAQAASDILNEDLVIKPTSFRTTGDGFKFTFLTHNIEDVEFVAAFHPTDEFCDSDFGKTCVTLTRDWLRQIADRGYALAIDSHLDTRCSMLNGIVAELAEIDIEAIAAVDELEEVPQPS